MKQLSVWMPAKACHLFYNDFTLFSAVPVLSNMYTDKDSNLISVPNLHFPQWGGGGGLVQA